MSFNVTVKSFSGKYGAESDVGDIINVIVEVAEGRVLTQNKEIVFLIDISGSMENSMKEVKSSLLAFRDSIVGKSPVEMEQLPPAERDQLLRNTIRVRLITFSTDAKEVWSNESTETFEQVVLALRTEAMTNMGDALTLAFDKTREDIFTWIIVMTDGESNKGPCRTAESFQKLVTKSKPLNCRVVSLGYGSNFDPEVLDGIGEFVYVEDPEVIPVVLGNLAEEILTAVGFNGVLTIDGSYMPSELTDETVIVAEGEDKVTVGRFIVGDRVIGPLCYGKTYEYVYLPHGNKSDRRALESYKKVTIHLTDIIQGENISIDFPIIQTDASPSDQIREMYFDHETKRLIYRLYKVVQNGRVGRVRKEIKMIHRIIDSWNDELSDPHKDVIIKMIQDIEKKGRERRSNASTVLNLATSNSYNVIRDDGRQDGNDTYAGLTLSATRHYMASPLVNNSQ